jgi:hypothetical protein
MFWFTVFVSHTSRLMSGVGSFVLERPPLVDMNRVQQQPGLVITYELRTLKAIRYYSKLHSAFLRSLYYACTSYTH